MPIEEQRRIRLFERLTSVLGREDAATLLEMLPPPGQDMATLDDLRRELADVVRKDDLRDMVRKDDLAHHATKADLYRAVTVLAAVVAAIEFLLG